LAEEFEGPTLARKKRIKMTLSETILTEQQRQAGLELREDDHCVYLVHRGEVVAVFSALRCTPEALRKEAERRLKRDT